MSIHQTPRPDAPYVEINLNRVCENYRAMASSAKGARAAAVVKCDGYGLGAIAIARTLLLIEKCGHFYVAHPAEGAILREALRDLNDAVSISILHGPTEKSVDLFRAYQLTPVLNSLEQCMLWHRATCVDGFKSATLHIDTGMNRLGAPAEELQAIAEMEDLHLKSLITHLADSSDPASLDSREQWRAFMEKAKLFQKFNRLEYGISASGGALTNTKTDFDLGLDEVRLGVGLYGVSPLSAPEPRVKPVARLMAPVLQVHTIPAGAKVGYGGLFIATRETKIATVALGYGDGFIRAGSDGCMAFVGGAQCPVAGRISMDLITLDVTDADNVQPGDEAEFFGENIAIEDQASACDTIGYELLTRLGPRITRTYMLDGAPAPESLVSPIVEKR